MITLRVNNAEFRNKLKKRERDIVQRANKAVEVTAREAVNHAKSLTSVMTGPAKAGEPPRKTHPGGWSDVTSNLVNSIQTGEVKISLAGASIHFGVIADIHGSMEYAEVLENRDGYSVLGGADVVAKKSLQKHATEILS